MLNWKEPRKLFKELRNKLVGWIKKVSASQTSTAPATEVVKQSSREMWRFILVLLFFYGLVLLAVAIFAPENLVFKMWGDASLHFATFTLTYQFLIIYTIASIRIVWYDEVAAKTLFFGWAFQHCGRGIAIVPLGICGLVKLTGLQVRKEVPGEPNKIFRGDGAVPDGMVPPIRITAKAGDPTSTATKDDSDPLETRRVVYEIAGVVGFQIDHAPSFVSAIGTTEKAVEFLEDEFARGMAERLQAMTYAEALKRHRETGEEIAKEIEEATKEWGVRALAYLKPPSGNHELNRSITGVAQAQFDGKSTVIRGEAEGKAAKETGVSAEMIVGARVAEKLATGPNNTIITGENPFGQLIGALKTTKTT